MVMTQDVPPTPQHRVGRIGGRPSQCHDATTSRSPFITRYGLTHPSERHPRQPAPTATTTPWSPQPASPQPPAPRADGAKPRAGASGCSEDRRRWEPPRTTCWGAQRAERFVCKEGPSGPHRRYRFPQLCSQRRSSSSMAILRGSSQRGQTRATNQRSGRVWRCSQNQQVNERVRLFMAGAPRTTPAQPGAGSVKGAVGT